MKYNFSADWFGQDQAQTNLKNIINFSSEQELHILEIGSYEGRSTIWFIENYLYNCNSTITCIDPWSDYSQDENSMNSYNKEDAQWKFGTRKIIDTFNQNIESSGKKDQVIVKKGLSSDILPQLIFEGKKYEIIFIDGNHVAPCVMTDAIYSWNLLQNKGIMIFDDYLWMPELKETLRPKLAIDSFINVFSDYLEVIMSDYRKAVIKKQYN